MDYIRAIDSIGETMEKVAEPLTDNQKTALVGCLAVWLQKAYDEGRATRQKCAACGGHGKVRMAWGSYSDCDACDGKGY